MINRLPVSLFLIIGMLLIAVAALPVLRYILGVEQTISLSFLTIVMFCIAGLMSGLSGMVLLLKRQINQPTANNHNKTAKSRKLAAACHTSGLLLYTGLPFANFLACFWLWNRHRHQSTFVDHHGKQAINFQITIYLYLLIILFIVFITFGFGLFLIPIPLVFHLVCTLLGIYQASKAKKFTYPANLMVNKEK